MREGKEREGSGEGGDGSGEGGGILSLSIKYACGVDDIDRDH